MIRYTCPKCGSQCDLRQVVTLQPRYCGYCRRVIDSDEVERQEAEHLRRLLQYRRDAEQAAKARQEENERATRAIREEAERVARIRREETEASAAALRQANLRRERARRAEEQRNARNRRFRNMGNTDGNGEAKSLQIFALGCTGFGVLMFVLILIKAATQPKPIRDTQTDDPFPLPRPTRPVQEEENPRPRTVVTFPEAHTPRKSEPAFRPVRIGKGTLVVRRKTPVADYIPTWVEIDGRRAADWLSGEREVKMTVLAGTHRVTVHADFNSVVRTIHESTQAIIDDQTVLVDMGE